MRNLTRTLAALPLVLAAGTSFASEYAYIDLGTLGGNQSVAFGMNEQRQIVGWSSTAGDAANNAFLWEDGVMTDLGRLGGVWAEAWAINESGVVVGHFSTTPDSYGLNAFVYENGVMTALPTLSENWSSAQDINTDGTIVGISANSIGHERAVKWEDGQIIDLGDNSSHQRSRAFGINDAGLITGWEYTPMQGPNDAYVYDGVKWLQIGGFGQYQSAEAYEINETGTVVGYTSFPSGDWHGALWHPDGQGGYKDAVDMGLLPGTEQSEAYDLNDAGDAVGSCQTFSSPPSVIYTAFAYLDGVLYDLRDLLPDGVDVELVEARDINNNGDIVGTARVDGHLRAFMLQVQTGCPADLDGDGDTDQADLGTLLASYGVAAIVDVVAGEQFTQVRLVAQAITVEITDARLGDGDHGVGADLAVVFAGADDDAGVADAQGGGGGVVVEAPATARIDQVGEGVGVAAVVQEGHGIGAGGRADDPAAAVGRLGGAENGVGRQGNLDHAAGAGPDEGPAVAQVQHA